jgi:hypothetical protein
MSARRVQLMATCLCDAFFDDVASGQTQRIEASTNAADLQACRAWTPPTS